MADVPTPWLADYWKSDIQDSFLKAVQAQQGLASTQNTLMQAATAKQNLEMTAKEFPLKMQALATQNTLAELQNRINSMKLEEAERAKAFEATITAKLGDLAVARENATYAGWGTDGADIALAEFQRRNPEFTRSKEFQEILETQNNARHDRTMAESYLERAKERTRQTEYTADVGFDKALAVAAETTARAEMIQTLKNQMVKTGAGSPGGKLGTRKTYSQWFSAKEVQDVLRQDLLRRTRLAGGDPATVTMDDIEEYGKQMYQKIQESERELNPAAFGDSAEPTAQSKKTVTRRFGVDPASGTVKRTE